MPEVTCVGILCADVLAKPVDSLPEKGRLLLADEFRLESGGCAANVAIGLSKLGIDTAMIGKTGKDGFGAFLRNTLLKEGVDISGLREDPKLPTSASFVAIDSKGERSIIHCTGANAAFTYSDIDQNIVSSSQLIFVTGVFLMPSFDGEDAARLLSEARRNGKITCADTAWDSRGAWMKKIGCMLEHLDWFMPSYDEAAMLTGLTDPEEMAGLFEAKGVRNTVIKLGAKGCHMKPEGMKGFTVPAFNAITAVDTSGAGDAFCAGFTAGLTKCWDHEKCAVFANAVGALCVTDIGTTSGIRSMDETLDFIKTGLIHRS